MLNSSIFVEMYFIFLKVFLETKLALKANDFERQTVKWWTNLTLEIWNFGSEKTAFLPTFLFWVDLRKMVLYIKTKPGYINKRKLLQLMKMPIWFTFRNTRLCNSASSSNPEENMSFHKFPIDNQQRKNSIVNIRRDKRASIWFLRGYCSEMAPGTVERAISR